MRSRAWTLGTIAVLVGALGVAAYAVSVRKKDDGMPPELLGRWVSEDPRYADRTFSIEAATIAFGVGGTASEIHAIERVETHEDDGAKVHTVRYRESDGAMASVELRVVPGPVPALRFENHSETWIRENWRR